MGIFIQQIFVKLFCAVRVVAITFCLSIGQGAFADTHPYQMPSAPANAPLCKSIVAMTANVLETKNSDVLAGWIRFLSEINFTETYAPDRLGDMINALRQIAKAAQSLEPIRHESAMRNLRERLSWYYFYGMRNTPSTNDIVDFHSMMEEVDRILEPYWSHLETAKKIKVAVENQMVE